jgi:hypothetical protein
VRPEDLVPVLVRLTPTARGRRIVAAVRARAVRDRMSDDSWNVREGLRERVVQAKIAVVGHGAARLQPSSDLAPGEYAIVVRFGSGKKLAGSSVLSPSGAGRVFGAVWAFSVK